MTINRRLQSLSIRLIPLLIALSHNVPIGATAPLPKVLVVQSYNDAYAWQANYMAGLRDVLGDKCSLISFAMDTKNLPPEKHAAKADQAWRQYRSLSPAVVILADDAALKYLGPRLADTLTPFVFLGINSNPRTYFTTLPRNMTGVLERPLILRGLEFIRHMLPDSRKTLMLFDTDLTSDVVRAETFHGQDRLETAGFRIDLRRIGSWDEWQSAILTAPEAGYGFLVLGLYQTIRDARGAIVPSAEVAAWTSSNARIPVFGLWDFSVGPRAAIGGFVLVGRDQGVEAGRLARFILDGQHASAIPFHTNHQGSFLFSTSQLERWKLVLPEDIRAAAAFVD
jgi:ABC-type uncharacterized transport system substrate-binding protein